MRPLPVLAAAIAAALLTACTAATPPVKPVPAPDQVPQDCPLTVTFASYAMGIDRETHDAVERLLTGVPYDRHPWGREGEVTLCVHPRTAAEKDVLLGKIQSLFPSRPRGPLSVSTSEGRAFRAPAGE
ncbi:hypothetical protein ACFQ1E_12730 [Sphingomonas canadensis]|uniref:Uncharacterized protein n=1 Tax=Sphingomonas canadensis TaxID=1219257 RepID=A0ABW3HAL2_9SPHN|nr:hypothetical protein [Sphingomonas canadensis]MCW3836658.1 hypothetical protein [Sphingomonas canadensis]